MLKSIMISQNIGRFELLTLFCTASTASSPLVQNSAYKPNCSIRPCKAKMLNGQSSATSMRAVCAWPQTRDNLDESQLTSLLLSFERIRILQFRELPLSSSRFVFDIIKQLASSFIISIELYCISGSCGIFFLNAQVRGTYMLLLEPRLDAKSASPPLSFSFDQLKIYLLDFYRIPPKVS